MSPPSFPTTESDSPSPRVRVAASFPGGLVMLWTISLCTALAWSLFPEVTQPESGAAYYRQPEAGQPTGSFTLVTRTSVLFVSAVWPLLLLRRGTWQPVVTLPEGGPTEPRNSPVGEPVPSAASPPAAVPASASPLEDLFAEPHPELPTVEPEGSARLGTVLSKSLVQPSGMGARQPGPPCSGVAAAAVSEQAIPTDDAPIPLEPPPEMPTPIRHSAEPVTAAANKLPPKKLPENKPTQLPLGEIKTGEVGSAEPPAANLWAGLLPTATGAMMTAPTPAPSPAVTTRLATGTAAAPAMAELVPPLTLAPPSPPLQPARIPLASLVRAQPMAPQSAAERPVTGGKAVLHLLAMAVSAVPIFAVCAWLSDVATARLAEVAAVLASYALLHSGYAAATCGWTRWAPDRLYCFAVLGVVLFWPWAAVWCAEFSAPPAVREFASLADAEWHPRQLAERVAYEGLPLTGAVCNGELTDWNADTVRTLTSDPVHRALLFPAGIGLLLWLISPLSGRRV